MKSYFFPVERGFVGPVLLQRVEVFQEEEPGGLLGVVELRGAARLFPENVVDILEGLFKHSLNLSDVCPSARAIKPYLKPESAAVRVSHLRRSGFSCLAFPALAGWANLCRAYGAGFMRRRLRGASRGWRGRAGLR